MATGKRSKRDRAQKIRTVLNTSTVESVATGAALATRDGCCKCGGVLDAGWAQANGICLKCAREVTAAPSTRGVALIEIDDRLMTCIRQNVEIVRAVYPDVWDSEWGDATSRDADAICAVHGDLLSYVGAIEYVRGAADVFDMTALELIGNLGL